MREINRIILHCSATPEGRDVSTATIRRWHVEERLWADIGYHFVIELDGSIHEGRPEDIPGAHAQGHNHDSLGVCYVGGVDAEGDPKDTRTPDQKEALRVLVEDIRERYGPQVSVHGHNEFTDSKACPSFDVQAEFGPVTTLTTRPIPNQVYARAKLKEFRHLDSEALRLRAVQSGLTVDELERVSRFYADQLDSASESVPWWRRGVAVLRELTRLLYAVAAVRGSG